eukprot:2442086-Pyramimonas_sp.AAC.1
MKVYRPALLVPTDERHSSGTAHADPSSYLLRTIMVCTTWVAPILCLHILWHARARGVCICAEVSPATAAPHSAPACGPAR